ncbi:hypothetical protein BD779DRAFT_1517707 [Infundibulicybe gibba]|nr:hypothetical protein BD779DRAFT_1517707 [Infundibulicybe gibba]
MAWQQLPTSSLSIIILLSILNKRLRSLHPEIPRIKNLVNPWSDRCVIKVLIRLSRHATSPSCLRPGPQTNYPNELALRVFGL